MTEKILDYYIDMRSRPEIIDGLIKHIKESDKPQYICCANTHSVAVAERDQQFKEALINADILLPDGIGMIHASKLLGGHLKERNSGPDVFLALMNKMNEGHGHTCFFLGASPETLVTIQNKVEQKYPNIEACYIYSPPFADELSKEDNKKIIAAINEVKPDVLWVGMTAPKQEKWVKQNVDQLDVKVIGCVGAAFDFFAETKKRTSSFFRDRGLEWLPRFIREPKRMFSRIVISTPRFFVAILKERGKK